MLTRLINNLFTGETAPPAREVLRLAQELIRTSRADQALALLEPLNLREPGNAACLFAMALAYAAQGERQRSLDYCGQSRLADPHYAPAKFLQAELLLGGENYMSILKRIHARLRPRTYVEIGVFRGEALALAEASTRVIGIDPDPKLIAPLAANQKMFAMTSDRFFGEHDLRAEFNGLAVDLAFIDGMHHFEFALRDFANIERHCTSDSVILIHDGYPLDRETARRDGAPPFWSGDIWRLIVLLKKYRPDLSLRTLAAPPTGLVVVQRPDPDSRFLLDQHDRLCEEFLALDYAFLDEDKPGKLNLVAGDWETVNALFAGR